MNRQQFRRLAIPIPQQPLAILTPPSKHLVGIYSMRPRHARYRRPRLQRLLDDPPLLRHTPKAPFLRLPAPHLYRLLRSVHLFPKWTLPSVPTKAIILDYSHFSQTARSVRLQNTRKSYKTSYFVSWKNPRLHTSSYAQNSACSCRTNSRGVVKRDPVTDDGTLTHRVERVETGLLDYASLNRIALR